MQVQKPNSDHLLSSQSWCLSGKCGKMRAFLESHQPPSSGREGEESGFSGGWRGGLWMQARSAFPSVLFMSRPPSRGYCQFSSCIFPPQSSLETSSQTRAEMLPSVIPNPLKRTIRAAHQVWEVSKYPNLQLWRTAASVRWGALAFGGICLPIPGEPLRVHETLVPEQFPSSETPWSASWPVPCQPSTS